MDGLSLRECNKHINYDGTHFPFHLRDENLSANSADPSSIRILWSTWEISGNLTVQRMHRQTDSMVIIFNFSIDLRDFHFPWSGWKRKEKQAHKFPRSRCN